MKWHKKQKKEVTEYLKSDGEETRKKKNPILSLHQQRARMLSRTAGEVRRYRVLRRILAAALGMMFTATGTMYMVSVLYRQTGSFTVNLDKFDMTERGLSLSESRTMSHPQSSLNADIDETITNISVQSLPADLDMIDGRHNGENHIAYTFYLQNAGEESVDYEYTVFLSGITQQLDSAIRIRLYYNGAYTDYARTRSDGTGPEPGTEEFYSEQIAAQKYISDFSPGEIDKFTVVIWIEGDDPDCTDFLIGGKLRVDMSMSVAN